MFKFLSKKYPNQFLQRNPVIVNPNKNTVTVRLKKNSSENVSSSSGNTIKAKFKFRPEHNVSAADDSTLEKVLDTAGSYIDKLNRDIEGVMTHLSQMVF
ncbi:hypothetical protein [Candidatus Phytoplasma oryzae]|nr:hypothetical protein PIE28_01790 [Candidatus Phytoplasma oryzae]